MCCCKVTRAVFCSVAKPGSNFLHVHEVAPVVGFVVVVVNAAAAVAAAANCFLLFHKMRNAVATGKLLVACYDCGFMCATLLPL
jgi:hypothetical protein